MSQVQYRGRTPQYSGDIPAADLTTPLSDPPFDPRSGRPFDYEVVGTTGPLLSPFDFAAAAAAAVMVWMPLAFGAFQR